MDYGLMPPEINSGRMYAGVGSASLVASAAAWQSLAAELGVSGGSFESMVSALSSGPWLGPSSMAMLSSALPYVAWMMATAAQCEQAAISSAQAANAFETARASVIPPPMIAENRVRLMTLIATNFMGVNSGAIAATEAEYEEFWAQDASTMYGFASESAGITGAMIPFMPPAMTTNPAGLAAQAAAVGESTGQAAGQATTQVGAASGELAGMPSGMGSAASLLSAGPQMMGMIPQALHGLTSPLQSLTSPLQSLLGPLMNMFNPSMLGGLASGVGGGISSSISSLGSLAQPSGFGGGMPSALMGRAGSLPGAATKLSVPASWVESTQATQAKVAAPLAQTASEAAPDAVAVPPRTMVPAGAGAQGSGSSSSYPVNMMGDLGKRAHEGRPRSLPEPGKGFTKLVF